MMSDSETTPQRAVIQFCYRLGKSPLETLDMMKEASGKHSVNRSLIVYWWYRRFNEGNDSLEDEKRSGRPLSSWTNEKITLVQNAVNDYMRITIRRWLGWAMVLGSFQCRGVLLLLHIVGQGPAVLAASAGRLGYIFIFFIYLPFLMSGLLGDG